MEASPRDLYEVREIDSATANELMIENHYLHRKASTMFSWGLFEGDELIGAIIYGKPASPMPCRGVCGPDEADHVIELTRLWISDSSVRNAESFLIGATLRLLPPEFDIVLSYAELAAGHTGVVYRASNWLYTGKSAKHGDWVLDGDTSKHNRHRFKSVAEARAEFGDRMVYVERPRKNRYVYLRGSKTRRRELKRKLRYREVEYEH